MGVKERLARLESALRSGEVSADELNDAIRSGELPGEDRPRLRELVQAWRMFMVVTELACTGDLSRLDFEPTAQEIDEARQMACPPVSREQFYASH